MENQNIAIPQIASSLNIALPQQNIVALYNNELKNRIIELKKDKRF
jgi:hypothetical protein